MKNPAAVPIAIIATFGGDFLLTVFPVCRLGRV